jgi:hypothetical protein
VTIDRLKGYITKCGVRKVWKREFEGLSEKQCIARLEGILRELGMEGRPTLEKCRAIKEKREFQEELKAIEDNQVIETRLRSQNQSTQRPPLIDDTDTDDEDEDRMKPAKKLRMNLLALGDPEDD